MLWKVILGLLHRGHLSLARAVLLLFLLYYIDTRAGPSVLFSPMPHAGLLAACWRPATPTLMLLALSIFAPAVVSDSSVEEVPRARESGAARSIVFIVADDLGFNDVSFHGSPQIPTPAIDELAATGLVLDNYHAQPVCTPTRASILTGRHAIHHGIYMPFAQGSALRLNLSYTLLPRYLQRLGYATHAVGKWHLGQNELAALPTVPSRSSPRPHPHPHPHPNLDPNRHLTPNPNP